MKVSKKRFSFLFFFSFSFFSLFWGIGNFPGTLKSSHILRWFLVREKGLCWVKTDWERNDYYRWYKGSESKSQINETALHPTHLRGFDKWEPCWNSRAMTLSGPLALLANQTIGDKFYIRNILENPKHHIHVLPIVKAVGRQLTLKKMCKYKQWNIAQP